MNLHNLTPKQKKIAAAVGLGGVLLVLMLARKRNADNTAPATDATGATVPGTATGAGAPADFSGDQTGTLAGIGDTVAAGLGQVGTSLDSLANAQAGATTSLGGLAGSMSAIQASVDQLGQQLADGAYQPATGGTPGPDAVGVAAGRGTPNTRSAAAVTPKNVVKGGSFYHFYDTDPSKPGYERKVRVRAASTPKAKAKAPAKPKAKAKAPARSSHRSPSVRPAAHHAAPTRKRKR